MGRHKEFNRDEVLDSAIQIFWRKGYADTSLKELEEATGVNKSGLYSEFKDKDDLFIETLKRYKSQSPALEILGRKPLGWQNIEDFLKMGCRCEGQKGCYFSNTLREASNLPKKVSSVIYEHTDLLQKAIKENIKATPAYKQAQAVTDLIISMSVGLSLKLNVMKPEQIEKEVKSTIALLRRLDLS